MPIASNSKIVKFSQKNMYEEVLDVESYPQVISIINKIEILEKLDGKMKARVHLGTSSIKLTYDCLIEYWEPKEIKITLISGPFKKLTSDWKFEEIDENSCRVTYFFESEFENKLLEFACGPIFFSQLEKTTSAFEKHLASKTSKN